MRLLGLAPAGIPPSGRFHWCTMAEAIVHIATSLTLLAFALHSLGVF